MQRILSGLLVFALVACLAGCVSKLQRQAPNLASNSTFTLATEPFSEPTDTPTEPPYVPTAPLPEPEDDDFVRILDYVPQARQMLAYATTDNFTGQVIYEFADAYLRYGTVKKLSKAADELEKLGLGLLIWDGYRPVYAQAKLYDVCPNPTWVSPPGVGNQNHCRGRAVDLTLFDLETGEALEMPTGFDDFSPSADRDYSDVSPTAASNARILEEVMTKHGFKGYSAEWWHYNDTDSYPIEEEFDPAKIA